MPDGKRAGERCVQLDDDLRCMIFGDPRRPKCCSRLQPSHEMWGESREFAMTWIARLEVETQPH
ncbi:Proteinase inhibitor [Candidatus Burkholderia brachyanthoides]|nr:Proteinase inhibitor [Candidatus Burkholderia brachyanthoides]